MAADPLRQVMNLAGILTRLPGVAVRDPMPHAGNRLEVVVPADLAQAQEHEFHAIFGAPVRTPVAKPRGLFWFFHPVRKSVGVMQPEQTLYCTRLPERGWMYLWLLPWSSAANVTLAFGFARVPATVRQRALDASLRIFDGAKKDAGHRAQQMQAQARDMTHRHVRFDPVLHYFVTPSYAGPDRRSRPTPAMSRFSFFGKRKRNVTGLVKRDYYSDRIAPQLLHFLWMLSGLSLLDAVTTIYLITARSFQELNPVMRAAIDQSPWTFLAVKLTITLVLAVWVLLHQHFRVFPWVLRLCLVAYALLDLRALVLVLG